MASSFQSWWLSRRWGGHFSQGLEFRFKVWGLGLKCGVEAVEG